MKILGAAVIGLAGFGIPLTLALILYRRRHQLYSPATFRSLGFLYDGYAVERGLYAFESVAMLRKASAVMIGNLVTDAFAQLTSALLLLTTITVIQLLLQPFAVSLWAALDTLSMVSLLATLAFSLMYLRWTSLASQCSGLAGSDVLTGTVLTCEQVRAEANSTEVLVTVLLLLIHAAVLLTFAVVYARLIYIRRLRARVRSALVDSALAEASFVYLKAPASGPVADSIARLAETSLQVLFPRMGIISSTAAGAKNGCCGCGQATMAPRPPALGRRASTAVFDFIKGKLKRGATVETAGLAAAKARVTPSLVTAVAAQLRQREARAVQAPSCLSRCCAALWCCFRVAFIPLDSGLHAACESSEATTARVFGDASATTGSTDMLATDPYGRAVASAVDHGSGPQIRQVLPDVSGAASSGTGSLLSPSSTATAPIAGLPLRLASLAAAATCVNAAASLATRRHAPQKVKLSVGPQQYRASSAFFINPTDELHPTGARETDADDATAEERPDR